MTKHAARFEEDKTYTLIVRLRQNVIKTGIRRLSLSYSRISLRDICLKLHLDSEEDAEYIVGKAIRDGVIEGRIIHEKGWMECEGRKNGYGPEVSDIYMRRITYCMDLHNQSVKVRSPHLRISIDLIRNETTTNPMFRRCVTRSMLIARNSPLRKERESVRESLQRKSRKGIWMTTIVAWATFDVIAGLLWLTLSSSNKSSTTYTLH